VKAFSLDLLLSLVSTPLESEASVCEFKVRILSFLSLFEFGARRASSLNSLEFRFYFLLNFSIIWVDCPANCKFELKLFEMSLPNILLLDKFLKFPSG
jgi:hypothetical protein